jgi:hypothetical protein
MLVYNNKQLLFNMHGMDLKVKKNRSNCEVNKIQSDIVGEILWSGHMSYVGEILWSGHVSYVGEILWSEHMSYVGEILWSGHMSYVGETLWSGHMSYVGEIRYVYIVLVGNKEE